MEKRIVKNYKKPAFLMGAALATAAIVGGCSKTSQSPVQGATTLAESEETVTTSLLESQETTLAETTLTETTLAETTTEELVLSGDVDIETEPIYETDDPLLEGELVLEGDVLNYAGMENLTDLYEKETVSGVTDRSKLDEAILSGLRNFCIEAFKKGVKKSVAENTNAMISPESLFLALGMTANGALDNTKTQMLEVLAGTDSLQALNDTLYYYNNVISKRKDNGVILNIADSIWIDNCCDFQVSPDFLKAVRSYYDADVFYGILKENLYEVNNWVYDKTNGMIENMLDRINEDTMMLLINTIAFEGEWREGYDDYSCDDDGTFTKEDGSQQTVTQMCSFEDTYISDDNTTGFVKYYLNGRTAFMAMLPDEGISLENYVDGLSAEKFDSLLSNMKHGEGITVRAKLPAFSYDFGTSFKDTLIELGMSDAFDGKLASFDGMGTVTDSKLVVSDVIQKTHIDVDKSGTKAAAATVVEMDKVTAMEPLEREYHEVFLDRPFVYAIVDTITKMPIFIGTVSSID